MIRLRPVLMLNSMLLLLCLGATSARAEPVKLTIDDSHTRIWFTVTHLGFSTMPGMFRDFDVDFNFDKDAPQNSSLAVTIQSASIDMFHDGLNDHLRNPDFFNVEKFPTITFKSTSVEMVDANNAKVSGDFTLLGVTKPVTFDVKLNQIGELPMMKGVTRHGFGATGIIDRSAFGMGYGVPMVGNDIAFQLSLEATLGAPTP